jgi:hypothetical protein
MVLKDSVPDSQRTKYRSLTKFNSLVLFRKIIADYSVNYEKRINKLPIGKIQSYLLFEVDGAVV